MSRSWYMPVQVANSRVKAYMDKHCPRHEYEGKCKTCGKDYIKHTCGVCGVELDQTIEKYELYGNYCPPCDRLAKQNVKHIKTDAQLNQLYSSLLTGRSTPPGETL